MRSNVDRVLVNSPPARQLGGIHPVTGVLDVLEAGGVGEDQVGEALAQRHAGHGRGVHQALHVEAYHVSIGQLYHRQTV